MPAHFATLIAAARYSNAAMATYQRVLLETRAKGRISKIAAARRSAAKAAADKAEETYLLLLSDAGLDALPPEIAALV